MEMIPPITLLVLMVKTLQLKIIRPALEEMMIMIVSINPLKHHLLVLLQEVPVEVKKVNQVQKVLKVLPDHKVLLVNQVEPAETVEMEKKVPSVIQVKW